MSSRPQEAHACPGFPRYVNIAGHWISSFKLFLCAGIYVGILVVAAVAERSGFPPLPIGLGCLAIAILGLIGARLYHLFIFASHYVRAGSWAAVWDPRRGGSSVFGALLTAVPASFVVAALLRIPAGVFWDLMSAGILAGGFWARLGCVFNGCCGGRETRSWFGVRLQDTQGVRKRRIPVQFLEMAWWLLGGAGFIWLWPRSFPSGNYALGVLGWYGVGRFWLETLRENPDLVGGRVRINQVVAAALALVAGGALLARMLTN